MKIVTPAKERRPFWLFAHELTCPECEVIFRVEPGDRFSRHPGPLPDVQLDCPHCHRALLVWKPRAEGDAPRLTFA